jgi:hypothetical protein
MTWRNAKPQCPRNYGWRTFGRTPSPACMLVSLWPNLAAKKCRRSGKSNSRRSGCRAQPDAGQG